MRKILILTLPAIMVFLCCSSSRPLYITGDGEAIGAEIFIDGQKVGIMERVTAVSTSKHSRLKPGEEYAFADIRVHRGEHTITIVSKDGKRLEKSVVFEGENYMSVDFGRMVL